MFKHASSLVAKLKPIYLKPDVRRIPGSTRNFSTNNKGFGPIKDNGSKKNNSKNYYNFFIQNNHFGNNNYYQNSEPNKDNKAKEPWYGSPIKTCKDESSNLFNLIYRWFIKGGFVYVGFNIASNFISEGKKSEVKDVIFEYIITVNRKVFLKLKTNNSNEMKQISDIVPTLEKQIVELKLNLACEKEENQKCKLVKKQYKKTISELRKSDFIKDEQVKHYKNESFIEFLFRSKEVEKPNNYVNCPNCIEKEESITR